MLQHTTFHMLFLTGNDWRNIGGIFAEFMIFTWKWQQTYHRNNTEKPLWNPPIREGHKASHPRRVPEGSRRSLPAKPVPKQTIPSQWNPLTRQGHKASHPRHGHHTWWKNLQAGSQVWQPSRHAARQAGIQACIQALKTTEKYRNCLVLMSVLFCGPFYFKTKHKVLPSLFHEHVNKHKAL